MQPKLRKNLLFWTLLAYSGANWCCITQVDAALAANSDTQERNNAIASIISCMAVKEEIHQPCNKNTSLKAMSDDKPLLYETLRERVYAAEKETLNYFQLSTISETANLNLGLELSNGSCNNFSLYDVGSSCDSSLYSQQPPPQPPPAPQPPPREEPQNIPSTSQERNEPPQLEGKPNDFPKTSPTPLEQLLETPLPLTNSERLDRLIRRLQEGEEETSPESDSSQELGTILAKPREVPPPVEQLPLPPIAKPVTQFKPIGSLRGYVGFFGTNNIFSSEVDPIQDGLVFSGLTLASAPLALGPQTYINAGIDGNLIFYIDQSQFNYNQIRFYASIYQQLSRRMYGELGWSNQQLFYAKDGDFFSAGDRFLNENSVRLSLGRRDPFYELRLNFADPDSRNRINNSLLLSLNYYWLRSVQVGLNYQFNLSDFTLRQREDQYHRLYANLTYEISDSTNVTLQGGVSLGDSTDQNLNFDGWFFGLNYNWELGKF
jgi:hypothetical protein